MHAQPRSVGGASVRPGHGCEGALASLTPGGSGTVQGQGPKMAPSGHVHAVQPGEAQGRDPAGDIECASRDKGRRAPAR